MKITFKKRKSVKEKVVEMRGSQGRSNIHTSEVPGKEEQNTETKNV